MKSKTLIKEIFPVLILAASFAVAIHCCLVNTDRISTHLQIVGNPDEYTQHWTFFVLPVVSLLVYLLLSYFQFHPDRCNYPYEVEEVEEAPALMSRFILWMKDLILLFLLATTADENDVMSVNVFVYIVLGLCIVAIIAYFLVRFRKLSAR
jgi:hypothetical protein